VNGDFPCRCRSALAEAALLSVQIPRAASPWRSTLDNGLALYLNAPPLETEIARAAHKTTPEPARSSSVPISRE
jgi:hypothetical protein